jgi:very-short-patch-repair endonuclease
MIFSKNDPGLKNRRRELRRTQTDAEKVFWSKVRGKQLFGLKFFRQYSFGPYILDFYCPAIKLAIELDGGQHNEAKGMKSDAERYAYLYGQKIEVLQFWDRDVLKRIESVLEAVANKIVSVTPPDLPLPKGRNAEAGAD